MMGVMSHFYAAGFAIACVTGGVYSLGKIQTVWNAPETFMTANVHVPNHKQGVDPIVQYRREVFRDMRGIWTVEIRRLDKPGQPCQGTGAALYSPKEFKELPLKLSVFAGVECSLNPGKYVMATRWDLTDTYGSSAVVQNVSKPFIVTEN